MSDDDKKKGEFVMSVPLRRKPKLSEMLAGGKPAHPSQMNDEELKQEAMMVARKLGQVILENRPVVDELLKRHYGLNANPTNEELLGKFMERHQAGFVPKSEDEVWN